MNYSQDSVLGEKLNLVLGERDRLNVVDIGHHRARFIHEFAHQISSLQQIKDKELYTIGIDPIDYNTNACNKFIQAAISTKTGKSNFNTYDEPGCNSLLNMKLENLVRDRSEAGWYAPHNISKTGKIEVDCVTLKSILDETNFDRVDFIKVDAQGSDLDCILSAEDWLEKTAFIQTESCVSTTDIKMMYEGQTNKTQDIKTLESLGFELLDSWDHSSISCPEADLIFLNKKYI